MFFDLWCGRLIFPFDVLSLSPMRVNIICLISASVCDPIQCVSRILPADLDEFRTGIVLPFCGCSGYANKNCSENLL